MEEDIMEATAGVATMETTEEVVAATKVITEVVVAVATKETTEVEVAVAIKETTEVAAVEVATKETIEEVASEEAIIIIRITKVEINKTRINSSQNYTRLTKSK